MELDVDIVSVIVCMYVSRLFTKYFGVANTGIIFITYFGV